MLKASQENAFTDSSTVDSPSCRYSFKLSAAVPYASIRNATIIYCRTLQNSLLGALKGLRRSLGQRCGTEPVVTPKNFTGTDAQCWIKHSRNNHRNRLVAIDFAIKGVFPIIYRSIEYGGAVRIREGPFNFI
eukprot:IDg6857t1